MKFSVVIPLYNKRNCIIDTIKSVLCQTFQDFEVIVIEDGSTDDSLDVVRTIESEKIRIIPQKNQGVAVARNTGIENAKAEYIAFLDADDTWHPDYLQELNDLTNSFTESDIYVTAYRILMGGGREHFSAHLSDTPTLLKSYWNTFKYAYDIVWTSATCIKRSAIIKAGKFTPGEKIGQDLDLWARVACNNPLVAYSPKICVDYHRDAEQNARTRVRIAHPKAFLSVLQKEMNNSKWTEEEKKWMLSKYNKKMIVYIYTSINANKRKEARAILSNWKEKHSYLIHSALLIASILPDAIIKYVYRIRMNVF